jgi:hypothetical protein
MELSTDSQRSSQQQGSFIFFKFEMPCRKT